ncbi:uncharacterized protein prr36a isoform X2 [Stigmatopora argus]
MKPDGVSMDNPELTEVAATAEFSVSQDNAIEPTPSPTGPTENEVSSDNAPKTNGDAEPQVNLHAFPSKKQVAFKTQASPRPKTHPHAARTQHPLNHAQFSTNNTNSGNKKPVKLILAAPATKNTVAVAPFSQIQTVVGEKRPVGSGASGTTSSASATARNGSRTTTGNGRPGTSTGMKPSASVAARVGSGVVPRTGKPSASVAARVDSGVVPKTGKPSTSVAARVDSGVVPKTGKSSTSTVTRVGSGAVPKNRSTTANSASQAASAPRPGKAVGSSSAAAVSSGSRSAPATSRPGNNCPSKLMSNATSKTAASRITTVPSTGRSRATQPLLAAATAKTDVNRPPSAALSKRPAVPSVATKPPASGKTTKPPASGKATSSKWDANFQKVNPTVSQTKQPRSVPTKSSSGVSLKPSAAQKSPLKRTPSASPANKSTNGNRAKPTQAISPISFVKNTKAPNCGPSVKDQSDAVATPMVGVAEPLEMIAQEPTSAPIVAEVGMPQISTEDFPLATPAPSLSPEMPPPNETGKNGSVSPQVSGTSKLPTPKVPSPPEILSQSFDVSSHQTLSLSKAIPATSKSVVTQVVPPSGLNDEEEEEEREGSQLVSVSEMSGTTQATEESRPGSAGQASGSAWRAGGAFLSELDSFSGSQQGASELSAPGVLEGTESMDDLGEGSLKGATDMEGASAGSPDFEKLPDIPVNEYEEDDDDEDKVCDMDMGSEKTDELLRQRYDNAVDDDDEDVEMASEGVTESGLESYGNADEDDFPEDERVDNLNRLAHLPPPPQLPSAPGAQWDRPNPFAESREESVHLQTLPGPVPHFGQVEAAESPSLDPRQSESEIPLKAPAQVLLEMSPDVHVQENQALPLPFTHESQMVPDSCTAAPQPTPGATSFLVCSESVTPEGLCNSDQEGAPQIQQALVTSPQPDAGVHVSGDNPEIKAPTMAADELLRGVVNALASNPSSSSGTEDEASDTEGEALLEDSLETTMVEKHNMTVEVQSPTQRCLSTVEEVEELDSIGQSIHDATPPSVTSLASSGLDSATTASNAQSTDHGCVKSPGIFSLEELQEESMELWDSARAGLTEQQYINCGKGGVDSAEEARGSEQAQTPDVLNSAAEKPEDVHPAYYSTICEKTDNSFSEFTTPPHRWRHGDPQATMPRLTCADLPPRKSGQQALSPQLRRLEQHQRQLMEMQQRREQQSRPLEGAEQERKRTEEEEQKRKKDEAEEEIKRNEREMRNEVEEVGEKDKLLREGVATATKEGEREAEKGEIAHVEGRTVAVEMSTEEALKRHELELQLQQQQAELKQRQQIMQWQQELEDQQHSPSPTMVPSPSSGLCTIYEALENSDEELDGLDRDCCERRPKPGFKDGDKTPSNGDHSSAELPAAPLDLDWGAKVAMVQQLINQTLLLNGDGCSSLLLLPGGTGGTLSPLESSLWPNLLPPISPPSATVTSVSSFSPEAVGSSPQGEWTVVELETHH